MTSNSTLSLPSSSHRQAVEDGTSNVAVRSANVAGSPENPRSFRGASDDNDDRKSYCKQSIIALIQEFCDGLDLSLRPLAVYYRRQTPVGQVAMAERILPAEGTPSCSSFARVLDAACQTAQRSNSIDARKQASPARNIFAFPIPLSNGDRDAIGFVFTCDESTITLRWLSQSIANQVIAWQNEQGRQEKDREAQETAALLEMLEQMTETTDLQHACYRLASNLQSHLKCGQVAIGFRADAKSKCRLTSLSGSANFDKRSAFVSAIESTMASSVQNNETIYWSNTDEHSTPIDLANLSVRDALGGKSVLCVPLQSCDHQSNGAIMLLGESSHIDSVENRRFLNGASSSLSSVLGTIHRSEMGRLPKIVSCGKQFLKSGKMVSSICAVFLASLAMLIPGDHTIQCQSRIEPTACRFIVAPFEGTLEKSLVEPGDLVAKGDLLARMDGREIRWKRASVLADQNQASKKRDAAQASHNYADQQIAQLEIERLAIELKLLDHRAENLEISSPVDGIVTSGDLARVEGAPLSIGQTLFEIAPLERMIAEVAIPDDQIGYAAAKQSVDIRLDAYPNQTWKATITQIQPRSEIRDDANVFIAEVEIDNADGRLRPGMKGRARVVSGQRAFGWILLHEPMEYLTKKFSW